MSKLHVEKCFIFLSEKTGKFQFFESIYRGSSKPFRCLKYLTRAARKNWNIRVVLMFEITHHPIVVHTLVGEEVLSKQKTELESAMALE